MDAGPSKVLSTDQADLTENVGSGRLWSSQSRLILDDAEDGDWQPPLGSGSLSDSEPEILDAPLDVIIIDSGSEEEDEPMILEELRMLTDDNFPEEVEEPIAENTFSWSRDYSTFSGREEIYSQAGECGPKIQGTDPLDLFTEVWDRNIMDYIVQETNRYAWETIATASEASDGISSQSRLNHWVETSVGELYRLFAVMIYMSLTVRGRIDEYWSTGILGMPGFRKLMTCRRYWLLLRFLHFVDNNTIDNSVRKSSRKVAKIKPIIDHCNLKFEHMYTPRREITIDESLLLFKGNLSWIQCIRTKAARFGIKFYELCESCTGYLLRFSIYTGKDTPEAGDSEDNSLYGFTSSTAKVVLRLMQGFLFKGHCLIMDSFYNSLSLTRFLKQHKTDVIGTFNRRRLETPQDIKQLNEKRMPRGEVVSRHCGDISVLSWNDVKLVTTVSTYHNADMIPAERAGVNILKPVVVQHYNKYMGGVDLKDQKLSMYLMERKRGLKWYIKVFKRLLNVTILNTYIIHCANSTSAPLSHRQFRYKLAEQLTHKYSLFVTPRSTNAPRSENNLLRLDGENDHFPIYGESRSERASDKKSKTKRGRCVCCLLKKTRKEVNTMCRKCKVFLCLGQCWIEYHTVESL